MKEKYYCLLLNNHNDTERHYVSNNQKISVIRGIIKEEVTDLYNLEETFMELDDKITEKENSWLIEGSFPIIATKLKSGVMIDAISGNVIIYSEDPSVECLSYIKEYEADQQMAEFMINNLSNKSKERYIKKLVYETYKIKNNIKDNYYYLTISLPQITDERIITAKEENGVMYDLITNSRIEKKQPNIITRNIEYTEIRAKVSDIFFPMSMIKSDYNSENRTRHIEVFEKLKKEKNRQYNNYVSLNKEKTFNTKVKTKEL